MNEERWPWVLLLVFETLDAAVVVGEDAVELLEVGMDAGFHRSHAVFECDHPVFEGGKTVFKGGKAAGVEDERGDGDSGGG